MSRMAQEFLDRTEIGPAGEQVGSRNYGGRCAPSPETPRHLADARETLPYSLSGNALAFLVQEHQVGLPPFREVGPRLPHVLRKPIARVVPEGHHALLVALADHPDQLFLQEEPVESERGGLRNAQAAGIDQLEERPVPQARRLGGRRCSPGTLSTSSGWRTSGSVRCWRGRPDQGGGIVMAQPLERHELVQRMQARHEGAPSLSSKAPSAGAQTR